MCKGSTQYSYTCGDLCGEKSYARYKLIIVDLIASIFFLEKSKISETTNYTQNENHDSNLQ